MLLQAALFAVSAASPLPPVAARVPGRATVRIVRGGGVRGERFIIDPDDRPTHGRLIVAEPDGRRFQVTVAEYP